MHRPRKRFGQNFLRDGHVLDRIVAAAELQPGDRILEIGPGRGALTDRLLATGLPVLAVEIDRDLGADLQARGAANLDVRVGDVLRLDWAELLPEPPYKLIANLPYNVSSQILFEVLDHRRLFRRLVLMFQKEVGDRLLAEEGSRDYGILSVLMQTWFDVERVVKVPPRCFYPPPKVDSVVLRFEPLAVPRLELRDEALFRRLVKGAFAQRRKTLRNSLLGTGWEAERVDRACAEAGIDAGRRGETLSLVEFGALANHLRAGSNPLNTIIATVNGVPIDDKALGAAMQSLAREQHGVALGDVPVAARATLREMALERLVARELIFQAALAAGVVADDAAVAEEAARILRMMGNPADFWQRLAVRGMDEPAFLRMVRKDVTVDRMTARKLEDVPEPAEAEIRAFFAAHPEQLLGRERAHVGHILLAVDPADPGRALEQARELRSQAQTGDFAELARRHSVCASAPGGGDLGFIRCEDVDPAFAEAAFSQSIGEVGEPVLTPHGCHLIKVVARETPVAPTLAEARDRIVGFLKRAAGSRLLEAWVAELRQGAEIVLHAG